MRNIVYFILIAMAARSQHDRIIELYKRLQIGLYSIVQVIDKSEFADKDNDYMNYSNANFCMGNRETEDFIIANQLVLRALNDNLWYHENDSAFNFLINKVFKYELYKERKSGYCLIVPIDPITNERYQSPYYITIFSGSDIDYSIGYNDLEKIDYIRENETLLGCGIYDFNVISKPEYDVSGEDMIETCKNIMECFNDTYGRKGYSLTAIRRYYSDELATIIVYNRDETQCYAYADIDGTRTYKPFRVDSENQYYVDRLLELSYIVTPDNKLVDNETNTILFSAE